MLNDEIEKKIYFKKDQITRVNLSNPQPDLCDYDYKINQNKL